MVIISIDSFYIETVLF